ncbi:MAG: macro domain-containing protein [Ignavibacteria bacterium]|nr:macro domain-containing protein [Ignavibacteria bacterium]
MKSKIGNTEIEIIKADITSLETDAIVNPANNFLMHHGGLAALIVRKGGMIIQEESRNIGNVPTGGAVITTGGKLKAKHVIHAVGPRYKDGNSGEAEKLSSAVKSSLEVAEKKKLKSIALPAISSGIFGYPIDKSSEVIVSAVISFFREKEKNKESSSLEKVILCLYDEDAFNNFVKAFEKIMKN